MLPITSTSSAAIPLFRCFVRVLLTLELPMIGNERDQCWQITSYPFTADVA